MDPSLVSAVASTGAVLSIAEQTAITSSLPLLKKNYKFSSVVFFGKLTGKDGDYLIAIGITGSWQGAKKYFYCKDGVTWAQLDCTEEDMANAATLPAGMPLSGDPSKVYTLPVEPPAEGEEEAPPKTLTEEARLAIMVMKIDTECAMAPAGALTLSASGDVAASPTFAGLSSDEALSISSYVLINKPKPVDVLTPAAKAATDFLVPATSIVPSGTLVARLDESIDTVVVRSLLVPGFCAVTKPGTPVWGYCYFGSGMFNGDIAFMLP